MNSSTDDEGNLANGPVCLGCGGTSWERGPQRAEYSYTQCAVCGFAVQKFSTNADRNAAYLDQQNSHYGEYSTLLSPVSSHLEGEINPTRLRVIRKSLGSGSSILEVGPGSGSLSSALVSEGFRVEGVEQSPALADILKRTHGLKVHHTDFSDLKDCDEQYDAVVSCHVIEHVLDVEGHLSVAKRVVKRGGYLFVATPNAGSWQHRMPGYLSPNYDSAHLQLFTRDALAGCLTQCGWTVVDVLTPDFSPGWLRVLTSALRKVKGRNAPAAGGVAASFEGSPILFSTMFFCFRVITFPLRWLQARLGKGNELFIVARKD